MKLKNKVAIVTGGSQGIGEAICYAYANEGAKVIVINKNHPELGIKVADKIIKDGGIAEALVCDISDEKSVSTTIDQIIKKFGRIDILVNNAGALLIKKFEEHTLEDWNFLIDTNLKGAFLMSRTVVPPMKKQKYGKIFLCLP